MRCGDSHLVEENIGELFVIMLAGVDEYGLNLRMAPHFPHKRSDFRKIRTRPNYIKDFQALTHALVESDGENQYNSPTRSLVLGVDDSQSSPKPHSFNIAANGCRAKRA